LEGLAILNQPATAATLLEIGETGDGVEVRILARPLKDVGKCDRGGNGEADGYADACEASPRAPIPPQRSDKPAAADSPEFLPGRAPRALGGELRHWGPECRLVGVDFWFA
jgi:hypothetical protein